MTRRWAAGLVLALRLGRRGGCVHSCVHGGRRLLRGGVGLWTARKKGGVFSHEGSGDTQGSGGVFDTKAVETRGGGGVRAAKGSGGTQGKAHRARAASWPKRQWRHTAKAAAVETHSKGSGDTQGTKVRAVPFGSLPSANGSSRRASAAPVSRVSP